MRKRRKRRKRRALKPQLSDEGILMAPVAEHRGVALVEVPGDKRTVWKGIEYETDGHIWMIGRPSDERFVPLLGCERERDARDLIEHMSEEERHGYFSYVDVLKMLNAPIDDIEAHMQWVASGGRFSWDDGQGVFVRSIDDANNRFETSA